VVVVVVVMVAVEVVMVIVVVVLVVARADGFCELLLALSAAFHTMCLPTYRSTLISTTELLFTVQKEMLLKQAYTPAI
jgi:hypothetical protein